jgi:ribosomal protein S18 acetylase RimI-like enzyme
VDSSELAKLEHENWIDYLAASVSLSADGLLIRDRGVVTALGHVPMRFFNQVLVEEPHAEASAIKDGVARGRERGDPFVVSLRDGLDDRFAPMMGELGLVASDNAVTTALTLHPVDVARPADLEPGFEIRRVTDETGLDDHRRTATAGFGADPSVAEAMIKIGLLERPECVLYVGYLNDLPVTSGLGWRTNRTIGVYNIATIPAARRHGFGEAMTAQVLADGKAAGCDVGALQASSMGRPIYQRMGFRMALRYIGYVEPVAPETPSGGP